MASTSQVSDEDKLLAQQGNIYSIQNNISLDNEYNDISIW